MKKISNLWLDIRCRWHKLRGKRIYEMTPVRNTLHAETTVLVNCECGGYGQVILRDGAAIDVEYATCPLFIRRKIELRTLPEAGIA